MSQRGYIAARNVRRLLSVAILALLTVSVTAGVNSLTVRMQLVPAILSASVGWVIGWGAITLAFGRVYCSLVCPLGTVQDGVAYVGRVLSKRPYRWHAPQDLLRLSVLWIVAGFSIMVPHLALIIFDPYSIYFHCVVYVGTALSATAVSVALCATALGLAAWRGRLWCNTVCPVGTVLGMLSRHAVYHPDINTDLCINCRRCADVCKSCCIELESHTIDTSRCVMCMNCTAVCPCGALTYRRGRHTLSWPLMKKTTQTPTAFARDADNK
ncbi:MAG: 4Fe-4S binding protein [Muribaculaceae bacterium]|nr:4Fe-4S binding protein [Muribaculaceae bacterium]